MLYFFFLPLLCFCFLGPGGTTESTKCHVERKSQMKACPEESNSTWGVSICIPGRGI